MGLFRFGKKKQEQEEFLTNTLVQSMGDKLGYPYQVLSQDFTYDQVMKEYEKAVERGQREGFIPVLLPEDEYLDEFFEILREDGYTVEEACKQIGGNGEEILIKRWKEIVEPEEEETEAVELTPEFIGELIGGDMLEECFSLYDGNRKEMKRVLLLEVPTKNPWEIPVYVPFGGWNDCPLPEEMATVCRYWYEKYGAVPAVITHDELYLFVPNPVPEGEAMELAKQHYAFCCDRVDQCTGSGTLGEVADSLRKSRIWYFWWD